MTGPLLPYTSEVWVPCQINSRIQSVKMAFVRGTYGCTKLDLIQNEDIRNELLIYYIYDKIQQYRSNWKQ